MILAPLDEELILGVVVKLPMFGGVGMLGSLGEGIDILLPVTEL